ncbi:LON peptidase substrate-binding domain-containing protein [Methanosarcina horonobensis]|uniref:LON peptidase substrate-binding domain-containing protein n=1 Tax=Methanosarcina horonobensis TaxID=418008 RepID=UPI000B158EB1|nr:hypothetical protein [Methanosarcina horonobensis]
MYSEQTYGNRESLVMPLFDIVVYPRSRAKFLADKVTGEILLAEMKNSESVHAIGLTVKSGTKPSEISEDSLYNIGNLLKIAYVQPADDGYMVIAKAVQRVDAVSVYRKNGLFYSAFKPVFDIPDLDEDIQAEMMENIKKGNP